MSAEKQVHNVIKFILSTSYTLDAHTQTTQRLFALQARGPAASWNLHFDHIIWKSCKTTGKQEWGRRLQEHCCFLCWFAHLKQIFTACQENIWNSCISHNPKSNHISWTAIMLQLPGEKTAWRRQSIPRLQLVEHTNYLRWWAVSISWKTLKVVCYKHCPVKD